MKSKNYFNEVSPMWDEMQHLFFSDKVRETAVRIANVRRGCTAADIGSGTGFISCELRKYELKIIAVDQSEKMLWEMKNRFSDYKDIEFLIGTDEYLPIESESVDYAFANMYLHHTEHPQVAIREMVRILKPNGIIVITDIDEHNYKFLKEEQFDRWLGFNRKDIVKWFKNAGLKNIFVDCVGDNCCTSSKNTTNKVSLSIFIAKGEKGNEK